MDVAEPEQLVPKGSQALYPIPFNDLDQLSFVHFLLFFYHPNNFTSTKQDWENIQDYCINWYLPDCKELAYLMKSLIDSINTGDNYIGKTMKLQWNQIRISLLRMTPSRWGVMLCFLSFYFLTLLLSH